MNKSGQQRFGLTWCLALLTLNACTTIPVDERDQIREEVNQDAEETIAQMVAADPALQAVLDNAVGYLVGRISTTKVPVVGGGYGLGVLHDNESGSRTYVNVTRLDLGAGLGACRYRGLIVFTKRKALQRFGEGHWQSGIGAATAVGTHSSGTSSTFGDGYTVHVISETGAAIAVTARLIRTSINNDLTDTGVSELSVPNTGFESVDKQGEDAPRIWDHKLPFMAQRVVDLGYDLPLPYGIGVTYATVDQE